ncbi:hypothetical protein ACFL3T_01110 [Patescibacteria group bacterium]
MVKRIDDCPYPEFRQLSVASVNFDVKEPHILIRVPSEIVERAGKTLAAFQTETRFGYAAETDDGYVELALNVAINPNDNYETWMKRNRQILVEIGQRFKNILGGHLAESEEGDWEISFHLIMNKEFESISGKTANAIHQLLSHASEEVPWMDDALKAKQKTEEEAAPKMGKLIPIR